MEHLEREATSLNGLRQGLQASELERDLYCNPCQLVDGSSTAVRSA